jgi:uncharacterized hydrophobic protein (TIGR00271 family)
LHLRAICPPELTEQVLKQLEASPAVTHLCVSPGAARKPAGDVVTCDIAREAATAVIEALRDLGLERRGGLAVESVDITMSEAARQAEREAPGDPADALVWEDIEQSAGEETRLSATYLAFMIVATIIASIGVMLDQPILIIGAMVVGPEFGPLAALCVGIVSRTPRQAAEAVGTLALGFAVGIGATMVATWVLDAVGVIEESMLTAERPLTSFIWQPDALSWIVAFLAGIAGMLSLTSRKSGALVGVLISVTTIPAAANAAAALAYWVPDEAVGSLIQLGLNLSAIVVGGLLTLGLQKAHQDRLSRGATAPISQE